MKFDTESYLKQLKDKSTRFYAEQSLEFAIKRAPVEQAIELKKLRTPGTVTRLELEALKAAGFPEDRLTPDGEPEILVKAYKAGAEHARKHWPQLASYYDMSGYRLSEVAA
jgi:hypothetical protein